MAHRKSLPKDRKPRRSRTSADIRHGRGGPSAKELNKDRPPQRVESDPKIELGGRTGPRPLRDIVGDISPTAQKVGDTLIGTTKKDLAINTALAVTGVGLGAFGVKSAITGAKAGIAARGASRITQRKYAHQLVRSSKNLGQKFVGAGAMTTGRAVVGRTGAGAKLVEKMISAGKGGKTIAIAKRFPTNAKSSGLTTKILIGAGLSIGAVAIARDIIGTYPFAAFGKEEGLQVIGFPVGRALDAGDLEGAQTILDASNEIINAAPTLSEKIPYLNVQKEFNRYVDNQKIANEQWQRLLDERAKDLQGTGEFKSEFEQGREESAEEFDRRSEEIQEASDQRDEDFRKQKLEEQALDAQYFALIRAGRYGEAEDFLQARLNE